MKTNFKFILVLSLFALFSFNSCQDEVVEVTQNQEETIIPESAVANLMRATATHNGALDDSMDTADCFSVHLPVTIIVNDITLTINSLEDLELIEELYNEFDDDVDFLEFLYPITIILNDYSEFVIENEEQLNSFIEDCVGTNDDVIECADFVYPISFSIYNSAFQIIDTVIIHNDEELYNFLENLEGSSFDGAILASLNFPVSLVYDNGSTIEVNNNHELEGALNAAEEFCEDDGVCDLEEVAMYLKECHWNIVSFNGDDNFYAYDIYFNENGTLEITDGGTTAAIGGHWELSQTDAGLVLTLFELTAFDQDLGGNWLVVDCDDDRFEFVRETGTNVLDTIVIERECESDLPCSAQEISMILQECYWYAGTNLYDNIVAEKFYFGENGMVEVINSATNQVTDTGSWNIALTDQGVFLSLSFQHEPHTLISLDWKVIECNDHRLKMIHGDNYLVFERECAIDYDCPDLQSNIGDACENPNGGLGFINENCECQVEDTNPFECFGNYSLAVCDDDVLDGFTTFNLELIFANCPEDNIEYGFYLSLADAEAQTEPLVNPFHNTTNPQTIYSRVQLAGDPSVFEFFEHQLIVEDCSPNNCSAQQIDAFLMQCPWIPVSVDGSNDFNQVHMLFNENGELIVEGLGLNSTGNWSTTAPNDAVYLIITGFDNVFQVLIGEWLVAECSETEMVLINDANNQIILQKACN